MKTQPNTELYTGLNANLNGFINNKGNMIGHFKRTISTLFLGLILSSSHLQAAPWITTDDAFLRESITVLADAGVIKGPVNTYPLPWRDIQVDVANAFHSAEFATLTSDVSAALYYVKSQMLGSNVHEDRPVASPKVPLQRHSVSVYGGSDTFDTQSFGARMDSQFGVRVSTEYHQDDWAVKASVNARHNHYNKNQDDQLLTADGSYLAKRLGNWWLSVDQMSHYWGPGKTNGFIVSNNARPFPAVRLTRDSAKGFETPWLSWIGPWSLSTYIGEQESSNLLPNIKLWGMRVNLKPVSFLELGFSRATQWGGDGRDQSAGVFFDMIRGVDNGEGGRKGDQESGNQLAGMDMRFSFPIFGQPMGLYGEFIGEDEANKMPSHYFYMGGMDTRFRHQGGFTQLFLEYTDTTVNCSKTEIRTYNCGYNHHMMKEGYRRYGRAMGSTYDNDTLVHTVGAKHVSGQRQWHTSLGYIRLNVDNAGRHPIAPVAEHRLQWDMGYQQPLANGRILIEGRVMERNWRSTNRSEVEADIRAQWQYQW